MKYFAGIFALIITLYTGCARLKVVLFDIRPIEMQSNNDLRNFISEKRIDSLNIYLLKELFILKSLKESINRAFLFDRNGVLISYDAGKENKKCLGNIWSYVLNYQKSDSLLLDSTQTFDAEWSRWITLEGREPEPPPLGGDLTIVYYWNTFSGNTNHRDFFRDIEEIMRNRPDLEIVFYKINQDLREGMDLEKYTIELLNHKDSLMKPTGP